MQEGITLYGAGGHCKVVMDVLAANGLKPTGIVDDNPQSDCFMGLPLTKPSGNIKEAIITIGNCEIRKLISHRIHVENYISVIHPSAFISPNATIGKGTVIMQGAIVQAGASIGSHCIINTQASVDHDCVIQDFVHVASGATICGECEVGECSWIGAGAVIKQCIRIGKNCIIGAGAVIIRDVPDNAIVAGNPGRIIKYLNS